MSNLHTVKGWHTEITCAPTALCGVTGKTIAQVVGALQRARKRSGNPPLPTPIEGVHPDDWKLALELLGYAHADILNYRHRPQQERPRIEQVIKHLRKNLPDDVTLVVCNDQSGEKGHVFAVQGGSFVDIPTRGEVEVFVSVHKDYVSHRADYVVRVTRIERRTRRDRQLKAMD